eukprot:5574035-Ditylum_brightwellii.AAC.1
MQGKSKLRKGDYVKKLDEEMAKNIAKFELFLSSAIALMETSAATTTAETTATNATATETTSATTATKTTATNATAAETT